MLQGSRRAKGRWRVVLTWDEYLMYDCMIQIGIKLGGSIFSPIQDVANNCDGAQPQIFVKYPEAVFKVKKKMSLKF